MTSCLNTGLKKTRPSRWLSGSNLPSGKRRPAWLDTLFKDQGEARQHVYEAVGEGFIADYFSDLSESEIAAKTDELALDAIKYLGKHEQELDAWKNN